MRALPFTKHILNQVILVHAFKGDLELPSWVKRRVDDSEDG
jgi:hypothetical protein